MSTRNEIIALLEQNRGTYISGGKIAEQLSVSRTAVWKSIQKLMDEGYKPAFIIGVPVGFVNVEAAKELIIASDIPYIVNRGRKGGSNIAAAICNALIYQTGA